LEKEDIIAPQADPKPVVIPAIPVAMKSILDMEGKGFSYHTFESIGKSVIF